jgi:hypothetical protein
MGESKSVKVSQTDLVGQADGQKSMQSINIEQLAA